MRDRLSVWSAVTEDYCARGCGLVTPKLPRVGTTLELTFWSDLFPESLEVVATTAWVSDWRVGVTFVPGTSLPGKLSPAEWGERLIDHGKVLGPESLGDAPRLVPVVVRRSGATARVLEQKHGGNENRPHPEWDAGVLILPVGQR